MDLRRLIIRGSLFVFDIYDVAMIVANVFTAYTIKRLFNLFFEEGTNKRISLLTYLIYCIGISICSTILDIPIINMLTTISLLLLISFTYKTSISKRIIVVALYIVISLACEIIVYSVSFKVGGSPVAESKYNSILGLFICKMLLFLLVLLMAKTDTHKSSVKPPISFFISSFITPLSSIVIGILVTDIEGISEITLIFTISMLMVINITTFALYDAVSYYYEEQMENVVLKNELTYYNNQFTLIKKSVEDTKRLRHDFNNHLLAVLSFLNEDNPAPAVRYINELIKNVRNVNKRYSDTGNVVVDSILNYKLSSLNDTDIDLEIETLVPYDLTIDDGYFVVILTNLIDNALEAIEKCPDSVERKLKIHIIYKKGTIHLTIQNTYDGELVTREDRLVTRKKTGNHGWGLSNVKNAVEKYNGILKVDHTDNLFTVKVLIYI